MFGWLEGLLPLKWRYRGCLWFVSGQAAWKWSIWGKRSRVECPRGRGWVCVGAAADGPIGVGGGGGWMDGAGMSMDYAEVGCVLLCFCGTCLRWGDMVVWKKSG